MKKNHDDHDDRERIACGQGAGCWNCIHALERKWSGDRYLYYCRKRFILSPFPQKDGELCRHFVCIYSRATSPHTICKSCRGGGKK